MTFVSAGHVILTPAQPKTTEIAPRDNNSSNKNNNNYSNNNNNRTIIPITG